MESKLATPDKTFTALIFDFLYEKRKLSKTTRYNYGNVLKQFVDYTGEDINRIAVETIESFMITKLRQGKKENSVNTYLRCLATFWDWYSKKYNVRNLGDLVASLPELPPRQRVLSADEYRLIIDNIDDYRRDIIICLCHTGLRASELFSLRPTNIYDGFIHIIGKGSKARQIPLNRTMRELLARDPNLSFIKERYHKWLERLCEKVAAELSIPHFYPHSCRHYFATKLYKAKVPISDIARLLGHSSPAITFKVYIAWEQIELQGLTDCLD